MFTIPVLGRAVRVYKQWFALCSYCATLTRVQPGVQVYGAEVCCMRCDNGMLGVENGTSSASSSGSNKKVCRFCGSVERQNTTGVRWKELKAPLDIAGPNSILPPPLRKVWYCPSHFKPWLSHAHRVMETRVVLAHLAHGAKPVFGADPEQEDQKLRNAEKKPPAKKQRRLPRKKKT